MARYLLIESRDPFSSESVQEHVELAAALRQAGNEVTLFLVQNGVLPCRPGADSAVLQEAHSAGVDLLADDFSLAERGIRATDLARGVRAAPIDRVIEHLAGGSRVLFL